MECKSKLINSNHRYKISEIRISCASTVVDCGVTELVSFTIIERTNEEEKTKFTFENSFER